MNAEPADIGQKLRKLRHDRRLPLKEVAAGTGLSASLLSMVERGERNLSVDNLKRLAAFFKVSVVEFFRNGAPGGTTRLVARGQGRKFTLPDNGIILELLVPDLNRSMEPVLQTVKPKHGSEAPYQHHGEELVYVIAGTLDVTVGDVVYELKSGDCLYLESNLPHRWVNNGEDVSVSLWVSCPPNF